jgi:hypothetical protein
LLSSVGGVTVGDLLAPLLQVSEFEPLSKNRQVTLRLCITTFKRAVRNIISKDLPIREDDAVDSGKKVSQLLSTECRKDPKLAHPSYDY